MAQVLAYTSFVGQLLGGGLT
jgi:hypothetical protein